MTSQRLTAVLAATVIAALVAGSQATAAITFMATNSLAVDQDRILSGEHWILAQEAQVDGRLDSSLFLMARTIQCAGEFAGNVWLAGERIDFSGRASDSLRLAAAQRARLDGTVASNLMAFGKTIDLAAESSIGNDALLSGENLLVRGTIGGDARLIARKVTLGGRIDGRVNITAEDIVLLPGTIIGGDLQYTAPRELVPGRRVEIMGDLRRIPADVPSTQERLAAMLMRQIYWLAGAAAAGWLWLRIFPVFTAGAVLRLRRRPVMCIGAGLLFMAAGLPLLLLLVWIPPLLGPALLLGSGGLFLAYAAKFPVALLLGTLLLRRMPNVKRYTRLATGMVMLYLAGAIPLFTIPVWVVTSSAGIGAMLLQLPASGSPPPVDEKDDRL